GHCHPAVTEAVCEQAGTLVHTSNLYGIGKQSELADRLCKVSVMDTAFFSNSGAEANEAAIKLARLWGHGKGVEQPTVVVTKGSFHGRTLATLTATGSRKVQAGFEPLVQGFARVPYNDLQAIHDVAANNKDIVAVLVEPVQGEGGIVIPDTEYLEGLRKICDDHGWLLMLDEIQTGMGRSGKWFAYQHTGIKPDVITLAKALGNGVPIGACLARGEAATVFQPGSHGSTFGGNPLACAAALAVIESIEKQSLVERAAELGKKIVGGLNRNLANVRGVSAVRGLGLLIGIELDRPCKELMQRALDAGLVINVTADNVVRLLPPLVLNNEEADTLIDKLSGLIREFLGEA
ncbi:MAG: aspartate aminotransferase family protein, partial [Acidiferrobacterales bacterium]|nr:aspartate aminotransferase family protein [Acidiferrobacterales bacterium]